MSTQIDKKDFGIRVKGKLLPVTMFIYDDGGASVQTVGGGFFAAEYAKVGGDNNWSFNSQSLLNYAKTKDSTITLDDVNKALYTEATTGSGSGGYFNTIRARGLTNNLTIDEVTQFAEAGVPGLKASYGNNAGQTKNADGTWSGAVADPPSASDPPPLAPGPGPGPGGDLQFNPELGDGVAVTAYNPSESAISKEYSTLVYPRDHGDSPYDFIQITPIEYVPGFGVGNIPSTTIKRVKDRFNYKQTGTHIFLPMTPGISETNSVGWGADELNPISANFGQAAFNIIQGFATNPGGFAGALQNAGNQMSGAVVNLLTQKPELSPYISAYFAGQAVGANLLGRSGIVINPNLELLFQGPKLRSFRYNFRFTPRDADEAKIVRTIIKVFKKTMAVRQSPGSLFLGVPSVYEIKYIYNTGGDHPFLNKIKPCALTAFNVNYTPDGSYMTYNPTKDGGGGSMTSYTVDMQFDEIEPIYNEDIDDVDGPTTGY